MEVAGLRQTQCAICGTHGNATQVYPATFNVDDLKPNTFSARRAPDRVHYRMVKCRSCGLVRSDPVLAPEVVEHLYVESGIHYGDEIANLSRTYGGYLSKVASLGGRTDALVEIGSGNGFVLDEALRQGYQRVVGVEPSAAAAAAASDTVRPFLVRDVLRPGLLPEDSFDVACLFQVFDHLAEPAMALAECHRALRQHGLLLLFNHNIAAVSARVLRRRSPIVDIEHTYLYSPGTMSKICELNGFRVLESGAAWNHISLGYLARLLPMPAAARRVAQRLLELAKLGGRSVSLPLGNLYLVAARA